MNITLNITHDNQNEGVDDLTVEVSGISLNLQELLIDYPGGFPYGDPAVNGYRVTLNPAGTPSMTCDNQEMILYIPTEGDWVTQSQVFTGYTLADRLSLEDRLTQVKRMINGE